MLKFKLMVKKLNTWLIILAGLLFLFTMALLSLAISAQAKSANAVLKVTDNQIALSEFYSYFPLVLGRSVDDCDPMAFNELTIAVNVANIIRVPQDQPTIQAGIDAAQDGDLVLVSPGTYLEQLTLSGKTITLASEFYTTSDENLIDQTVIDGQGAAAVVKVEASVGPETNIIGFTIQNGGDGISAFAKLNILNNRFIDHSDAIDYEEGGGVSRNNLFKNNSDDAIDLDGSIEVTIENNIIQNSGDDGIEIRLQEHISPQLTVIIRNNTIIASDEDGIQFIGYPETSNRVFYIEHNLIKDSRMVGIGLMDETITREDFRGASLPDRIYVVNNTFINNDHTITGGDNLIALNNIFDGSATLGLKNVDGSSVVDYDLFWNNTVDYQDSNVLLSNSIFADPLFVDPLSGDFTLQPGSPAIDAGTVYYVHNGETVLDLQPGQFNCSAPDIGAFESLVAPPAVTPTPRNNPTPTPTNTPVNPSVTLMAVADAKVLEVNPDTNYGTATRLDVDSPGEQSYIRFNVTGVTGPIQRAILRLFVVNGSSDGPAVYGVDNSWSEKEITWNNRPVAITGPIANMDAVAADTWVEYDLTGHVSGNGSYNFVFLPDGTNGVSFKSREGSPPPELVLTIAATP